MAKRLSAVLVGCGGMSAAWLDAARADGALDVVGLVDIRREAAERVAADYCMAPAVVFDTLERALKTAKPDVVFDVTTPESHYGVTTKALRAGCHVMGEKPLADSMSRARRMVQAARKAGRIYAVMQNRRYIPTVLSLVKMLRKRTIGDLTTVNADYYMGPHFGGFRDVMDHPLLLDMAIHTFDQARQITGEEPITVYCKEFNEKGSWFRGDASAMCIFEMTGGVVLNYRGSWTAEGFSTPWAASWRVIGTKGTALWSEDQPRAQVVCGDVKQYHRPLREVKGKPVKVKAATGHEACIAEFLNAVRAGERPQTVCEDNIRSLAMVFSAIKSAKLGRRVKVEW